MMCEAASGATLPPDVNIALVERYVDGIRSGGLIQGIRFDVRDGKASYRYGVGPDELGDITIEISARAARRLNLLRTSDPEYQAAVEQELQSGNMRIEGDPSRLGDWITQVHDPIVDRTV